MSNRRIPGYTAEVSIYSSANQYWVGPAGTSTPSMLQPQLRKLPGGGDCIPGCICVSPINCPCCDSVWPYPFPGPTEPLGPVGSF
jgi:hypothetical protein